MFTGKGIRRGVVGSLVVCICLVVTACSPDAQSEPVPADVATQAPEVPPSATYEPIRVWPYMGRVDTLERRAGPLRFETVLEREAAPGRGQEFDLVGNRFMVIRNDDERMTATVSDQTGELGPWTFQTDSDDLYIGPILFSGRDEIAVLMSPFSWAMSASSKSELYVVDQGSGELVEVEPPAGMTWSPWPEPFTVDGAGFWYAARNADTQRSCVVRIIDGLAELGACLDRTAIAVVSAAEDGAVLLTYPTGYEAPQCRTQYLVKEDDLSQLVPFGSAEECAGFDGTTLDDWEIWGMTDPDDPEYYSKSALFADGPNGERLAFGQYVTETLVQCHGYIYWQEFIFDRESSAYRTLRWAPGDETVTVAYEDAPILDYWTETPPKCSGGVLTLNRWDATDIDNQVYRTLELVNR